jgi:hypothetical protein
VQHLRDFVSEAHTGNMTPAQANLYKRDVYQGLQRHFGTKTEAVLKAFTDDVKERGKSTIDDRAPMTEAENHPLDFADQYEEPRVYGGGKGGQDYVPSEASHRQTYGNEDSQAAKLMKRALAENPDRNVRFEPHGSDPDKVRVVAEGMKQEGRLTQDELNSMKLDTEKTSHLTSKSRIDTGTKGMTLDALRITKTMNKKLPYSSSDDLGGLRFSSLRVDSDTLRPSTSWSAENFNFLMSP